MSVIFIIYSIITIALTQRVSELYMYCTSCNRVQPDIIPDQSDNSTETYVTNEWQYLIGPVFFYINVRRACETAVYKAAQLHNNVSNNVASVFSGLLISSNGELIKIEGYL